MNTIKRAGIVKDDTFCSEMEIRVKKVMIKATAKMKMLFKNKNAAYVGAAFLLCAVVLAGLLIFMPKGYAETNTVDLISPSDLILTQDSITGRLSTTVTAGTTCYRIDGSSTNLNNGIDITINKGSAGTDSDGYYSVYLILKNVNMTLSSDVSGITFQFSDSDTSFTPNTSVTTFNEDYLSMNKVKIYLYLDGSSSITGTDNAESALIQAENFDFVTETYDSSASNAKQLGKFTYYSQHIELIINSISENSRNSLTLTTGEGSYGAAIGSSGGNPIKAKLESVGVSESAYANLTLTYKQAWNATYYATGNFLVDLSSYNVPTLQYGAAEVTIQSGVVNITGNGKGAGIGNGGYDSDDENMLTYPTIYGGTITASAVSNTSAVRIENGTVSVVMSDDAKGSCFVNGAVDDDVADDGLVTIMGGSVYLSRQGSNTPYGNAYNDDGNKLYEYKAHYQSDAEIAKTNNSGNAVSITGSSLDLENVWETEDDFDYVITSFAETEAGAATALGESAATSNAFTGNTITYLSTYVSMTSATYTDNKYTFKGFYHDNNESTLYFYLPATRYEIYNLTINDNLGSGASFTPSYEVAVVTYEQATASANYGTYTFETYTQGTSITQTKYVLVRIKDVASYCTRVTGMYKQASSSGTIDNYVTKIDDYYYFYVSGVVESDMTIEINYAIGMYSIVYNYGLLTEDSGKESEITNNNSTTAECGTTYTLLTDASDVSWEGHTFAGWYSDSSFTNQITTVTSNTVGDTKYVYAKWTCDVIYNIEDSMGTFNSSGTSEIKYTIDYGTTIDFMSASYLPNSTDIDMGQYADLYEFVGWSYNDEIYVTSGETKISTITVSKDTYITAVFERSGYFVYITATYGDDDTNRDIKNYLSDTTESFRMIFDGGQTNYISDSMNSEGFYTSTALLNSEYVTITLISKDGYRIAGKLVTDSNGDEMQLISKDVTLSDNTNMFSFSMDGCKSDIYIYINFDVEEYSITYYDNINGQTTLTDGTPNPTSYTIESDDIVFVRPENTERNRYWKFLGFKEMGKEEIITSVPTGTRTGNLTLIAQWEEVKVYDISIYDDIGEIKAYVEGEEVSQAAEGETVTLKATAASGIMLNSIEYAWEEAGLPTDITFKYEVTDTTVSLTFTMPAADVDVYGDFEAIEYIITYVNLNGAVNDNPNTYTVFDSFDLAAPVKEGWTFKGWKLVVPDDDTPDTKDVKMIDIERIENSIGNLMLYADWEDYDEANATSGLSAHRIYTDESIVNGSVELMKTEAYENEYVFIRVSENEGYNLSSLCYTVNAAGSKIRSSVLENYTKTTVDISINKAADGLYYFVMPDNDVVITASYETETYSISYVTNGGEHANVSEYTIEDDIVLSDAVRSGYTFEGWYDENGEKVEELRYATGNIVLSAKWTLSTDVTSSDDDTDSTGTSSDSADNSIDAAGTENADNTDSAGNADSIGIEKRQNTYVSSSLRTGDSTDVTKLVIICVVCGVLLLLLIVLKNKNNDDDNDNGDTNG